MSRASVGTARSALERRALLAARSLVDRVRRLYRELEQLTGAPITAHRALACLGEEPGITASKLAAALGMQRPALSQALKGLVERGWVERVRNNSDQRSVRVYLTVAGRQVLAATAGRAVGTLQRAMRQLSNDELEGLAAGAEKVLSRLPVPMDEVAPRARPRLKRVGRTTTRRIAVHARAARPAASGRHSAYARSRR
ncbi:MAG TPA: MarR family transcriptional regulator [Steroidobacteraceae bacterium]|nr:MarR family transcriptional regulator [Steroidobacteraceae bacterium]